MKLPAQPRASAITRCTTALAIASFSLTTLAQAPPAQRRRLLARLRLLLRLLLPAQIKSPSPRRSASTRFRQPTTPTLPVRGLLDRKDLAGAETQFTKALKLNPSNSDYALALNARPRASRDGACPGGRQGAPAWAERQGRYPARGGSPARSAECDIVTQHTTPTPAAASPKVFRPEIEPWIREAPAIAGPITLLPNSGSQSFHIHSDVQDVLRAVLSSYGIRAVFDDSVTRAEPALRSRGHALPAGCTYPAADGSPLRGAAGSQKRLHCERYSGKPPALRASASGDDLHPGHGQR